MAMSDHQKYIRAMLHGKFQWWKNNSFMTRDDICVYSYGGRLWRCDKMQQTTVKELETYGYRKAKGISI